jgi:DNA-directed RNA polymerase specialized sigma24 family protein
MPTLASRFRDVLDEMELGAVLNAVVFNVWRSAGSFNPAKGNLEGWLYRIAEREAVNRIRQGRPAGDTTLLDFDPPLIGRRPDDTSFTDQPRVKELLAAIDQLPRLQRAVIRADLAAGDKADDERLALQHDSNVNSIRATRTIARKKLRDMLERSERSADPKAEG